MYLVFNNFFHVKMYRRFLIIFILFDHQNFVKPWDLSSYRINENFYVSDIAIYFNRAFLALPRKICANNASEPTLVEVPWKEFGYFYPYRNTKVTQNQIWAQCENLQSAISLAMEPKKSKLWILDQGNEFCPPKLVFYSLISNSFGERALQIGGVVGTKLSSIVIEEPIGFSDENSRAFISNIGTNSILLVYLDNLDWQIIRLSEAKKPKMPIEVDFMALSKTEPILYLSGRDSEKLFELDLKKLKEEAVEVNETLATDVTLVGYQLGNSTGLETDYKNGLIYYLIKDYAVVRWISGTPMTAETHNVLAQSYNRLPYVSRIFTGPQNGIWALVNLEDPNTCQTKSKNNNKIVQEKLEKKNKKNKKRKALDSRVVKVMKFNRFFDDNFNSFNKLEN